MNAKHIFFNLVWNNLLKKIRIYKNTQIFYFYRTSLPQIKIKYIYRVFSTGGKLLASSNHSLNNYCEIYLLATNVTIKLNITILPMHKTLCIEQSKYNPNYLIFFFDNKI